MKKIVALFMVLALSISCLTVANATKKTDGDSQQSNQVTLTFKDKDYKNMTSKEKGIAKLKGSGYTDVCISNIPDETIEKIATATSAEQTVSYYAEKIPGVVNLNSITDANVDMDLVRISKTEFDSKAIQVPKAGQENIAIVDENGQLVSQPDITASAIQSSVDGGTVKVITTMYSITNSTASSYEVVSSFQWTTMPLYRGTDVFGITRDSNTVYKPNTFGAWTYYQTVQYNYYAQIGGSLYLGSSGSQTHNTNLSNSDTSTTAFAIKYGLPSDYVPSSVLAGTYFSQIYRYNLQGCVWYDGALKQPSIQPTSFNHWSTYQHQKSTSWFSNPTVYYPWSASITISPTANYSTPIVDVILNTWKNNTLYNG